MQLTRRAASWCDWQGSKSGWNTVLPLVQVFPQPNRKEAALLQTASLACQLTCELSTAAASAGGVRPSRIRGSCKARSHAH